MCEPYLTINTDLGPISVRHPDGISYDHMPVMEREVDENEGIDRIYLLWFHMDGHMPYKVTTMEIDYGQMIRDWEEKGDYLFTYNQQQP